MRTPHLAGSFARKDGLEMQGSLGVNLYKFGFGAAAESHNTAFAASSGSTSCESG